MVLAYAEEDYCVERDLVWMSFSRFQPQDCNKLLTPLCGMSVDSGTAVWCLLDGLGSSTGVCYAHGVTCGVDPGCVSGSGSPVGGGVGAVWFVGTGLGRVCDWGSGDLAGCRGSRPCRGWCFEVGGVGWVGRVS